MRLRTLQSECSTPLQVGGTELGELVELDEAKERVKSVLSAAVLMKLSRIHDEQMKTDESPSKERWDYRTAPRVHGM